METTDDKNAVRQLGRKIGYGNLMYVASQQWGEDLKQKWNEDGGQFAVGPCVVMTVPCGCKSPKDCDWCCGSGWLTKHVKKVKEASKNE